MPGVIELTAIILSSFATTVFASTVIYYGTLGLIYGGISIGLNFLASALFAPKPPKPQDGQVSTRQPASPRYRHYGRVKISGPWTFAETYRGGFHKVLSLGQGPFDAFEEIWIDDNKATLDVNGKVISEPYDRVTNAPIIKYRLGLPTETYYSELELLFPEYTSDHRGDGVASIYASQRAISNEDFMNIYPNSINTTYRAIVRASLVKNPKTFATEWSENPSAIILDYMTHADGMRLPRELLETPLALAKWQTSFDVANQVYNLKAGGTEPRYRTWGSYSFDERPADILNRLLTSCDGRLTITSDGGIGLDIVDSVNPSFTLTEDMIIGMSEFGRGRDILTTANTIRAQFTDPTQDYQATDADIWIDEEDVDNRGEISQEFQFYTCPSHSQCRRLMKIQSYKMNPSWTGMIVCNLKAINSFGERFINIKYDPFEIDEVFEIEDFKFDIDQDGILRSITLQVQSLPAEAYDWNPITEEGTAPVVETVNVDNTVPIPNDLVVTIRRKTVGGAQVPFGLLTFGLPPVASLITEARGKRVSDTEWIPINVAQKNATEAESFALSDGEDYEFQIRYSTARNRKGDWCPSVTITATADITAPAAITGLVATGGTAQASLAWTTPNSSNYFAANVYRNIINDFGTATLVRVEYGAPSSTDLWVDTALAPGTYYYYLKSRNPSGVESVTSADSGAVVVT